MKGFLSIVCSSLLLLSVSASSAQARFAVKSCSKNARFFLVNSLDYEVMDNGNRVNVSLMGFLNENINNKATVKKEVITKNTHAHSYKNLCQIIEESDASYQCPIKAHELTFHFVHRFDNKHDAQKIKWHGMQGSHEIFCVELDANFDSSPTSVPHKKHEKSHPKQVYRDNKHRLSNDHTGKKAAAHNARTGFKGKQSQRAK